MCTFPERVWSWTISELLLAWVLRLFHILSSPCDFEKSGRCFPLPLFRGDFESTKARWSLLYVTPATKSHEEKFRNTHRLFPIFHPLFPLAEKDPGPDNSAGGRGERQETICGGGRGELSTSFCVPASQTLCGHWEKAFWPEEGGEDCQTQARAEKQKIKK